MRVTYQKELAKLDVSPDARVVKSTSKDGLETVKKTFRKQLYTN